MYAKLTDGQIEKYPYTFSDLQADHPNTSFPTVFDQEVLDAFSMVVVHATTAPTITYAQNLAEGDPELVDGEWHQTWTVTDKPTLEVEAIAKELRAAAYREESDPIFFEYQRGEGTMQDWLDKIAEIKARYPEGVTP